MDIKKSRRGEKQPTILVLGLSNTELFGFKYLDISLRYEYSARNRERWKKKTMQRRKQAMRGNKHRAFNEHELLLIIL